MENNKTSMRIILIANFGIIFALVIGVVAAAALTLSYLQKQAEQITERFEPQVYRMSKIEKLMIYISLDSRHAMLAADDSRELQETLQRIGENRKALVETLDKVESEISTEKGREIMKKIRAADDVFWKLGQRTAGLIQSGDTKAAFSLLKNELVPARNVQLKHIEEQNEWQRHLMNQALVDAGKAATNAKFILASVVGVVLLVIGFVVVRFISSVTGRLAHLQHTIVKVEQSGDCTLRTGIVSHDEVGKTAVAFDSMMKRIATLIGDTRKAADEIASSAKSMSEAGAKVESSSSAQSAAASSVSTVIEETSAGISETASNARAADEMASQARGDIEKTLSSVRETADSVGTLAGMIDEASKDVTRLAESSRQIDGIVRTIKEIADQTNLLALNAAIEAARAGEQGRGFAVVADEVRKLAENTAKATSEISGLISGVQTQVDSTVICMQTANEKARSTREHVVASTEALDTAGENTRQVTTSVRMIADAVREQDAAVQQVAQQIEQISRMADENTSAAMSAADVARNLDRQAEHLREAVGRFSV